MMIAFMALIFAVLATPHTGSADICAAMDNNSSAFDTKKYEAACDDHVAARIDKDAKLISEAELKGHVVACAMQRYIQSKVYRRFHKLTKAREQLDMLECELPDQELQRRALEQDERGSSGLCSDDWVLKLDATMGHIWRAKNLEKPLPVYPSFLDDINSPELLSRVFSIYLDPKSEFPSRAREGTLNNLTGLVALLYQGMPAEYRFHSELKATLQNILDNKWQDPATGFWGVPVKKGKRVESLPNISITFHIIGYRDGDVKRWPIIIDTILAMKDGEWPRGWKEDGRFSHHHLYDVVRLFRLGWPHMSANQRERAGRELDAMLAESVKRLSDQSYDFDDPNADEAAEAIDYHVFFHEEIGTFNSKPAFWRQDPVVDPGMRRKIVASLQRQLSKFKGVRSTELDRARSVLSSAEKDLSM